jgi:DNA modification methylase
MKRYGESTEWNTTRVLYQTNNIFKIMQSRKVKISEVKSNPNNPRQIKDDKFAKLVQSIKDFPEMLDIRPIVVNADMVVLGGNMRFKACKEAGLKEVPIIVAENLTDEQQKEFIIKDNVSGGEWDWDMLANEWEVEQLDAWGLDIPINLEVELEAEEDDFSVPEGGIETDIVLGDLFEIGEHRLLCGDSTDSDSVAKLMDGQKADMVFTDPPYGMKLDTDYSKMPSTKKEGNKTYDKIKGDNDDFSNELINTIFASFNDCKEIFIWGADYFSELLPDKNEGSWMVWDKRVDEKFDKMIGSAFELCWSKSKHQRKIARINNTLFSGEQDAKNKVHPTQKPIKLVTFFFDNWGMQNDLVADLYLGSGTTIVAAHQLKRKCYGMELDPKYCQVIIDRMKKLDPTLIIKRNGIRQD